MTRKASAFSALTGPNSDSTADYLPMVDASVADALKNKTITLDELKTALGIKHRPPPLSVFSYTADEGSATQSVSYNASIGLSLKDSSGGGGTHRISFIGKAVPASSPWTASIKARYGCQYWTGEDTFGGVALRNVGSGKTLFFGLFSSQAIVVRYYSAAATFSTTVLSRAIVEMAHAPMWWQIIESATDYTFNYSLDEGITWVTHTTALKASYFTADKIGVAVGSAGTSATILPTLLCSHYEDPDFP